MGLLLYWRFWCIWFNRCITAVIKGYGINLSFYTKTVMIYSTQIFWFLSRDSMYNLSAVAKNLSLIKKATFIFSIFYLYLVLSLYGHPRESRELEISTWGCVRRLACRGQARVPARQAPGSAVHVDMTPETAGDHPVPPRSENQGFFRNLWNFLATPVPRIRQNLRFSGISCHWVQKFRKIREVPTNFHQNRYINYEYI